ncbi:MAG: glycosyltransferase family 39 protein [Firmicutes bacterium]|nr:glycosyltransferase family 39 protein [Bacillota bacterium]
MTTGEKQNGNNSLSPVFYFLFSICLVIAAVAMYRQNAGVFITSNPITMSTLEIIEDFPFSPQRLFSNFPKYFDLYVKGSLIPYLLLLFPALALLAKGLSGAFGKEFSIEDILSNEKNERIFKIAVFILGLTACVAVYFNVLMDIHPFEDEYSYLFQAKIMAGGKLFETPPVMPQYFHKPHIVCHDKYYSKYTIGMPALLVPGVLTGLVFLISPLMAGGTLVFLYLTAKRVFNRTAGFIAVLIGLFSPYFTFLGATIFPHTACGFFGIMAMYFAVRFRDDKKPVLAFISGLAIGMTALIRPGDGMFLAVGFLPIIIWGLKESFCLKKSVVSLASYGAGIAIFLAVLGYANYIQNGSPFVMGFTKYDPDELFGFGANGHTPVKGLWNIFVSLVLLSFWTVPFVGTGVLSAFRDNMKKSVVLVFPSLLILCLYFAFYSIGNVGFGPRYLYPGWVLLIPLAAGGLSAINIQIPEKIRTGSGWVGVSAAIVFAGFMIFAPLYMAVPKFRTEFGKLRTGADRFKAIEPAEKSLLITVNFDSRIVYLDLSDYPRPEKEKTIVTYYLMPEENYELIDKYPDRKAYVVILDPETGNYIKQPYPGKPDVPYSADDYNLAALNYHKFIVDLQKSMPAFKKAYEASGGNINFLFNQIIICHQMKDYGKVEEIAGKIISVEPGFAPAYYYLARSVGERGDNKQALGLMTAFLKSNPPAGLQEKARAWIEYYSSKQ